MKLTESEMREILDEMTPDERQELAELYGEASPRAAAEWLGLSRGLKSLGDVPPCQLSAERLKEAILNQGIQQKPAARFSLAWLGGLGFAGVACMAAAAVITLNSWAPAPAKTQVVASHTPKVEEPLARESRPRPMQAPKPVAAAKPEVEAAPEAEAPEYRPERLIASIRPRMVAVNRSLEPQDEASAPMDPAPDAGISAPVPAVMSAPIPTPAAPAASAPASDQVVVISSQGDGAGAQATEVDRSGNVVFGG